MAHAGQEAVFHQVGVLQFDVLSFSACSMRLRSVTSRIAAPPPAGRPRCQSDPPDSTMRAFDRDPEYPRSFGTALSQGFCAGGRVEGFPNLARKGPRVERFLHESESGAEDSVAQNDVLGVSRTKDQSNFGTLGQHQVG